MDTPHLQGFIYFANAKSFSAVRKILGGRCHIEAKSARSKFRQCVDYCRKDGDVWESGQAPADQADKGEAEKDRWDEALDCIRQGDWENVPSDILLRYHGNAKRIHEEAKGYPDALAERPYYGIWIWGPPRTGKSHIVRELVGLGHRLYLKDINKWWDNYKGEDIVLIDEFEPKHTEFMTSFVKKWVDRWPFSAERKGGTTVLRPNWFIVTSNHPLDNVFLDAAIAARFCVVEKSSRDCVVNLTNLMMV